MSALYHVTLLCVLFFKILLIQSTTAEKSMESENLKKHNPGFFFNMPNTLFPEKNETVCLTIHHISQLPIKIVVDLKLKEQHIFTNHTIDSDYSCFALHVPIYKKKEPQLVSVKVYIHLKHNVYSAHNQDPIVIYPPKTITFVETDRTTYKPGDTVKLRLLSLDGNLLPLNGYYIPYLLIRNPLGISVTVWKNISTDLGLAHLQYELSKDSHMGQWKIELDGETKQVFEINKHTLPRFKVFVTYPKTIYFKIPVINIQVCAKYSYGAVVQGSAFLRLSNPVYNIKTIQDLKNITNGCSNFSILSEKLSLQNINKKNSIFEDTRINVHITATVTEKGTDRIELTTAKILLLFKPYSLKFIKKDIFFPGLPYFGAIQLTNVNQDLNGEILEICYNIAVRKSWNYLNQEQCSNLVVKNEKIIPFQIIPLKNNVIHLQITARSLNHTGIDDNLLVVRMYSPSSSYITIDEFHASETLICQVILKVNITYTIDKLTENENVTFYYMIKMRNKIYKTEKVVDTVHTSYSNQTYRYENTIGGNHKYIASRKPTNTFILKFKLDDNIISTYQFLIYYVNKEGEVISAAQEIKMRPCLKNKVKANWSHKQILPGSTASLLLETESESLCSVSSIDKATKFLGGVSLLNVKTLLKPFLEEKDLPESRQKSCIQPVRTNKKPITNDREYLLYFNRTKRYIYTYAEDYDIYDIFHNSGFVTISNFKMISKPCYTGPLPPTKNPAQFLHGQYDIPNDDKTTGIRDFFPESWLWELIPVRNAAVIHRHLPHTITTWVTNVLCVSATHGPGFSQASEITTFQAFFVDVLTPYSVKIGETLYLHTTVFNYLTYNIPVRIVLQTTDGFTLRSKSNNYSYCVFSNDTTTHIFHLTAVKSKRVNITVITELDPSYPGHCGPDILINKSDIVLKTVIIQPEGFPNEISKSGLLCASENEFLNELKWKSTLPKDVIDNTSKTEIIFTGDILGQTVQNLHNLITMPTGCGEQIMASLAPNIYVLNYLTATKSLTTNNRHKIIRNLKIGYQRILNYVHKDGSFSPFGYHDPSGSMFLTAFVIRVLQDLKKYIYINQKVIDRAVTWIYNHQLENGCFNTMYHVVQDMGGATFENSTAGLTAYVVISLLDSNISVPETIQTNAKYCIRGYYNLDKYTLAISSYALLKVGWYSEAQRTLKKLFQISNRKNHMIWWTNEDLNGSTASDIEITSYVLLSLLQDKTQENLANAHAIVQWLLTQQNPYGGFKSTQDTVVALDALTKYSTFVKYETIHLNVSVTTDNMNYMFETFEKDRMQIKKVMLKENDTNIKISIQGTGCILTKITKSFFTKFISTNEAFKIDMEVLSLSKISGCSSAILSSCFSYNGPYHQANMAVLEVDLPSGYMADKTSLYKLIDEDKTQKIKMFEELEHKIVFYLVKLNFQQICVNFNINENIKIYPRTNSTIKIYDYYKPEFLVYHSYKISDVCKFSNITIPDIVQDIRYNKNRSN